MPTRARQPRSKPRRRPRSLLRNRRPTHQADLHQAGFLERAGELPAEGYFSDAVIDGLPSDPQERAELVRELNYAALYWKAAAQAEAKFEEYGEHRPSGEELFKNFVIDVAASYTKRHGKRLPNVNKGSDGGPLFRFVMGVLIHLNVAGIENFTPDALRDILRNKKMSRNRPKIPYAGKPGYRRPIRL